MRGTRVGILSACLLASALAPAADGDTQDAGREIGAVLGWRLSPEVVEEWCRDPDPAGVEIRRAALHDWLERNAARISAVDERIDAVVPLLFPPAQRAAAVETVRGQVKRILRESLLGGKSDEEVKSWCHAEADPAIARWNSTGMPQIQQSLAALYDWMVRRQAEK